MSLRPLEMWWLSTLRLESGRQRGLQNAGAGIDEDLVLLRLIYFSYRETLSNSFEAA